MRPPTAASALIGHFAYLVRREAINRLRRQAGRLRSPRYALALLVGVGYFWLVFGGPGMRGAERGAGDLVGAFRHIGPLLLGLYVALTWLVGRKDALAYRPAEVHLLFPAPITRGDLLRYRLLRAQLPLFFTTAFITFASHGAPLPWWLRALSLYVLFATLHMHHTAAALVHASATQQGLSGWRRNWIPLLVFGAAALAVLAAVAQAMPELRAAGNPGPILRRLMLLLDEPGPRIALAPFRIVLAPVLAESAAAWLPSFGAALLVLAAHYVWVLRTDVAFEEAAAESGMRQARALVALRTGGLGSYSRALAEPKAKRDHGRAAFRLRAEGRPEVAIIWKNLTFVRRTTSRALPIMFAVAVGIAASLAAPDPGIGPVLQRAGVIFFALGMVALLVGPLWIRNDLRMDLRRIELIRTMPLGAGRLVGAQIASSALTLMLLELLLLGGAALLLVLSGRLPLAAGPFALVVLAGLLLVPAIITLGVTIQNAITLSFPAWVQLGAERPGGVEAMGQNIITMFGALVALALTVLPALLVGGVTTFALSLQWRELAPFAGGLFGLATLWAEVLLAVPLLGRLYARTDPTELGLTR